MERPHFLLLCLHESTLTFSLVKLSMYIVLLIVFGSMQRREQPGCIKGERKWSSDFLFVDDITKLPNKLKGDTVGM